MSTDFLEGRVLKSTGSWYDVYSNKQIYKCKIRGKLRTKGYESTNPVAVGDFVIFHLENKDTGVITEIKDRKNSIVRQSTNLSKKMHLIACNVDLAVIVVSLKNPATPVEFIDRFLVSAEAYSIQASIIFNKTDLYTTEDFSTLEELENTYNKIGYKTYRFSIIEPNNKDEIINIFKDKTTVISGNSGVGKTSIINLISPDYNLKTEEISDKHKTGKHTTTFAEMFELIFGGFIIDTPGIRAFGVSFLEKEDIAHNFPEMFNLLDKCKYYNCRHIDEPGCAVKEAFDKGEIAYSRYKSYLNIILEEQSKYRKDDYE